MLKPKPKNYTCDNCGQEQYTKDICYVCKGTDFSPIIRKENTHKDNKYLSVPADALENLCNTLKQQQELIFGYFLKQEKGAIGEDFTPSKFKCQSCEKEFYSWRDTCLSCDEVGSLTLIKMGKEEYLKRYKEIRESLLETGLYCLIEEIEYLRNENKQIKQAYDDRLDDIQMLQQLYDDKED